MQMWFNNDRVFVQISDENKPKLKRDEMYLRKTIFQRARVLKRMIPTEIQFYCSLLFLKFQVSHARVSSLKLKTFFI